MTNHDHQCQRRCGSARAPAASGPRSQSGKARSSRNATKHGIRSECPVIPEIESIEEWEIHRDAYVEDLEPEGPIETSLAEEAASLVWKLGRVDRFEREQTSLSIRQAADQKLRVLENRLVVLGEIDPADQAKTDFVDRIHRFDNGRFEIDPVVRSMMSEMVANSLAPAFVQNLVIRYRAALKRDLRQTLADLDRRQTKRAKSDQKQAKSEVKRMEQVLDTVMGPNHHKDVVLSQEEYRELTNEAEESQGDDAGESRSERVQEATAEMSAATVSSFGRNGTTSDSVTTSKTSASITPEISSTNAPSKGVDKHGFSLELTRDHRRKLWKEKVLKEKEEKRKRSVGNLPSNRPLLNGPLMPTTVQ